MKSVTLTEIETLLKEVQNATPVTFVAITDARANKKSVEPDPKTGEKTPNPYEKILKRTRVNGFIGYDYEAAVNRQRAREDKAVDFQVQERSWGENICKCLSEKDGKRYLKVKVQSYLESLYFGVKGSSMVAITKEEASKYIREKGPAKSQALDKEVDHKEYALANIENLTLNGESYQLLKG